MMIKPAIEYRAEEHDATSRPHRIASKSLSLDTDRWILQVKKAHSRSDEAGWHDVPIGEAWLPSSPVNKQPIQLKERPELCWTIVAVIDTYLLRQGRESKSAHVVVSDIARHLFKLFEYAWLNGFYRIQDMPQNAWEPLRKTLVLGGWVAALKVEERTARLLAKRPELTEALYQTHRGNGRHVSVASRFFHALGTNIAGREIWWVRTLIQQAAASPALARCADISSYERLPMIQMSESMLKQTLRAFDMLADVKPPLGLGYSPNENAYEYAIKHGRKGGRTENLSPESVANLLKYSYKWITEFGPLVVDMVEALAFQLAPLYSEEVKQRWSDYPNPTKNLSEYRSTWRSRVLALSEERQALETALGRKITNYVRRTSRGDETSVYAVLNQLFSACFVALALMNARRKDEVSHGAIGLHEGCTRVVDAALGLVECEFYIEKTYRDYLWFFANDISQQALSILKQISWVAWGWAEHAFEIPYPTGRDRKLFCFPAFASAAKRGLLWFDFNGNPDGMANEFLEHALGALRVEFVVAPHMFRRGYGLIYHYRYENATLVALAQKYGHLNVTSTLRYVTNDSHTPVGKHAAVVWSAPAKTLAGQKNRVEETLAEVNIVGRQKLRQFVADVVAGSKSFGGGFARLVERFHQKLSSHVQYKMLDEQSRAGALSDALTSRGHAPEPFSFATCMAGEARKSAKCATNGRLARERASGAVCGSCAYSVVTGLHLDAMREDAATLEREVESGGDSVRARHAQSELANLRRVIYLQQQRLAVPL